MAEKKQELLNDEEKRDQQVRIWFSQTELDTVDKYQEELGLRYRSDFIRDAIKFYAGYLEQEKNIDYLSPVLGSVIKSEIDGAVRNISEMLFKMAVQESLLTNVIAFYHDVGRQNIQNIQRWCESDVAESNGVMSFEKAYGVQHPKE